jgi:glycosyltransferase involved in cell wall biosynthesis
MIKVIIQIPCKNEAETLPKTFHDLPKYIPGVDVLEYLIINDGSTDRTSAVARELGIHHIIEFKANRGLGIAFHHGVMHGLMLGADIIVNTDGDNQYPGNRIPDLIKPILEGKAEVVVGNRNPGSNPHFTPFKRFLQRIGNHVVSFVAGEKLPDSVSGFRAYSREALYEINVTSRFSYVVDTLIQVYKKGLAIAWVDIETHAPTRPSRLFRNIWEHIGKTTMNIGRVYMLYEPLKIFFILSLPSLILGTIGVLRFMHAYFFTNIGREMIQSLFISGVSITIGITLFSLGIIGDLMSKNRTLSEQQLSLLKRQRYPRD